MSKADEPLERVERFSELEQARVHVTTDNRLRVEFRIQDLIKKLIPGGDLATHCGGCKGCMGCGQ
jgi:hypothetical protein